MLADLRARADDKIMEVTKHDVRRPNIYFDFVEDTRFNAVAMAIDDDEYLTLVNTRVIAGIPDLFRNLFSLPEFAPRVGNPSLEFAIE